MRANIKLGLFDLTPVRLLALFNNVIAKLTGSAVFTAPPVAVPDLTAQSEALADAIELATDGSLAARKQRDALVLEVRDTLRATAEYVRQVANGDASVLAQSGFQLAKMPEPITVLGVPGNVVATATDSAGDLLVRWTRGEGARMYRLERADRDPAAGEVNWSPVAQTARQRFVVSGLRPYEANWFRVIAIGIDREGLPSDVVMGRAA